MNKKQSQGETQDVTDFGASPLLSVEYDPRLDDEPSSIQRFVEKVERDFKSACQKMDVELLTKDEKFAVAVASGVKYRIAGKFGTIPTTDPCCINVVDGKWHVAHRENG